MSKSELTASLNLSKETETWTGASARLAVRPPVVYLAKRESEEAMLLQRIS